MVIIIMILCLLATQFCVALHSQFGFVFAHDFVEKILREHKERSLKIEYKITYGLNPVGKFSFCFQLS